MATTSSLASFLPSIPRGAQLFQRAALNPLNVTAATSVNIGWLSENKSQLEVVGELTGENRVNMYNFTFQKGSAIKLKLTNINGDSSVRVQLMDGSGIRVIADNQGNSKTKAAYEELTSNGGLEAKTGRYILRVEYGRDALKSKKQNYALQIASGTTFKADYRTLASAATIRGTLLAGGALSYNSKATTAAVLTQVSVGSNLSIFG